MIPKEVTQALDTLEDVHSDVSRQCCQTIRKFLKTTERYIKDLEQHVDDLVAGQHGVAEDD